MDAIYERHMDVTIENRSSSTALVRIRLEGEPAPQGGANVAVGAALLVRPVRVRELAVAHEEAIRQMHSKRMEQHNYATAQVRQRAQDQMQLRQHQHQHQHQHQQLHFMNQGLEAAERLRAESALRAGVARAQQHVVEVETQMVAAVCDAFELQRDERRKLPLKWMIFRRNVLLDCALRRLALAKLAHPHFAPCAPLVDNGCVRKIADCFAGLEHSLRSDLNTGSFVELTTDREQALLACGVVDDAFLSPVHGSEVAVLLSGLKPHTCFEVVALVVERSIASTASSEPGTESDSSHPTKPCQSAPVEFWTEQAAWQMLLSKYGLSGATMDLLGQARLNCPADWAELLDAPHRFDSVSLEPAERRLLDVLCREEGAVTQEEQRRLDVEALELEDLVQSLLPAALDHTLSVGDPVRVLNFTAAAAAAASNPESTATRPTATSSEGDDARDSLQLQLVEAMQMYSGLGVVCAFDTGGLRLAAVRLGDGSVTLGGIELSMLEPREWMVFISHAQLEAQNQCALLVRLLAEAWYDMDAERLEVSDMCRGIAKSGFFLLYLTKSYFSRWFCRLEASVAMALGKQLVVVYESDPRHHGHADYVQLAQHATKQYPKYLSWLLDTEAIPMARRAYARRATVSEIARRLGVLVHAESIGSLERCRSNSSHLAQQGSAVSIVGLAHTHSNSSGGLDLSSDRSKLAVGGEQLEIVVDDLRADMARLQAENQALWRFVDELRRDAKARDAEMVAIRADLQRFVASDTGSQTRQGQAKQVTSEEGVPPA